MYSKSFTGLPDDDRRIARELQAMGANDFQEIDTPSSLNKLWGALSEFITWMRWKGEVNAYGCRVGAERARALETSTYA